MDAAFMGQVKDRVAKATESVASLYDPSRLDDLPKLPTLQELLLEFASNAAHQCGECGAVLLEGSRCRICFACGELQPAAAAAREPERFDFDSSLALQLFFDSLKLDGSALGIKRASPSKAHQESEPEQRKPEKLSSGVKEKLFAQVEEEDIWESAEGEAGAVNWTQQLSEANADDFFSAGVPAASNSSYSATVEFPESRTDDFDDFFHAAPQSQSQGQSLQHNLDFFQNPPQSKSEVSFPVDDVDHFALGHNHPPGQSSASTDALQVRSAEAPTKPSALEHQGSSNVFFEQLEGLNLSRGQASKGHDKEPGAVANTILKEAPDLSFMLADHLVVPGGKKKSLSTMWSFKEID
ncbi:hypothetical protein R1sor_018375 [Riccia sorocarpa]|uniref:Uncharacterized protein n=1 Tax=Riccia sorocarpa TaxID=122646 RepID=A0ABD3I9L7_9MARC